MIAFEKIEARVEALRADFVAARPFAHVVIDDFLQEDRLKELMNAIPDPLKEGIRKSRDYVFAKNKYEKSGFRELSDTWNELYEDLISERFSGLLKTITGEDVFVDPDFHGGGIHQGGMGSFLDMHADFNLHPVHSDWFRNLNVLIYLNEGWKPEFGGELKLRHKDEDSEAQVEPLMNRCVIMHTRDYTLHGYDPISFPPGQYRRSVATYAYSYVKNPAVRPMSTTWYPQHGGPLKAWLGRWLPMLVRAKNAVFGSSTQRNR